MAEHGEWTMKGAALGDVTAEAEYGVDRSFIIKGIKSADLEYRNGEMWGNPYLRVLRSQLEKYISKELGDVYLANVKHQAELREVKKNIASLKKKLKVLESRKTDIELLLKE